MGYILKGQSSGLSEIGYERQRGIKESRQGFSLRSWSMVGPFPEENAEGRAAFEEGKVDILSCLLDIQTIFWVGSSEFTRKVRLEIEIWEA